jgi:soluble lytic murein transglycosylase-like protein
MLRFIPPFLLVLPLLLAATNVLADVYKFTDGSGHVYYTDKPKHAGFMLVLRSPPPFTFAPTPRRYAKQGQFFSFSPIARPNAGMSVSKSQKRLEYSPLINAAANKYSLDPALLHAVIRAESGYNPGAVSNKGAAGLMQLMPATASRFGVRDRFDPQDNIEGGARYLRELLGMFPSNVKLAVAAYNSGENTVKRYGYQVPPIAETQNYVEKVLGYYNQ